jgi:hypothetical protein
MQIDYVINDYGEIRTLAIYQLFYLAIHDSKYYSKVQ